MNYQDQSKDSVLDAISPHGDMDYTEWETAHTGSSSLPVGKEGQAALVRIIGARMKQARELCNLSQSEAARQLGYANPSKLSKIESATDTNSVPLWLIARAAEIYEVSTDFLFGRIDDWETGPRMTQERELSAWLKAKADEFRQRDLDALRALNDHLFELGTSVAATYSSIREMDEALKSYMKTNPVFEDMRGSNRLLVSVQRALAMAERGDARIRKLKMDRPVDISQ